MVRPRAQPPPEPTSEAVSRSMKANKGVDTSPELLLRSALWRDGIVGYRTHNRNLPGRPDISFSEARLAIFVHGCFWHRCPNCKPRLPKAHRAYWKAKFE